MIIVGIDPGTRAAGFGVIEVTGSSVQCREYGVIKVDGKLPLAERLYKINSAVEELLMSWRPEVVGVEEVFYGKNVKTAITLGHVRGVIILEVHKAEAELFEFSPTQIKKTIVGNGHASKDQVEFMVRALLRLPPDPIKDDAFDALAIALCANNYRTHV